jgi:small subunit ribosomal protein S16
MALKIRLRQQGRRNRLSYRLVVADCRSPRDGKYVEILGWYAPIERAEELQLSVCPDRIQHWLDQGALFTEKAEALVARAAPELMARYRARIEKQKVARSAKRRKTAEAAQ